jgi:LacI family transcriptional regulator
MIPTSTRSTGKLPTQKDVARLAGVSQAVVSVVLGGNTGNIGVSSEASERVLNAAKRLNYRPNLSARSMRHGRFFNIGYFTATNNFGEVDFAPFRAGIYDAASEQGFHVMMIRLSSHLSKDPDAVAKTFREAHLDAMVINPFSISIREIKEVVGTNVNLPIVYLNAKEPFGSVYVDDYLGARMATEHFYKQGFRRIAFFHTRSSNQGEHYSKKDRIEGYMSFMAEHGLVAQIKQFDSDIYADKSQETEDSRAQHRDRVQNLAPDSNSETAEVSSKSLILEWLRSPSRPEAVVCYNDPDAMALQQFLYELRLRVPEDMAVIGYNNDEMGLLSSCPLSSIHVPRYEMAVATVNMAISLINMGESSGEYRPIPSIKFTPKLVVRQSSRIADSGASPAKKDEVASAIGSI